MLRPPNNFLPKEGKSNQEKLPKKLNQPVYFDIPIKVKLKILRILK